jgi:hypothetical protein
MARVNQDGYDRTNEFDPYSTATNATSPYGTQPIAAPQPYAGQPAQSGAFQPYDPTTSGRLQPNGTLAPPVAASPFSQTSTAQDLIAALNAAGAAPGSAQATALTKQYTDALGITGNALPTAGFSVGQYDPTRNKIYLPGTDLKYDQGQWGNHPFGTADQTSAAPAAPVSSPFLDTFRQGLLTRLQQLQAPTDPNSPAIAAPTAAYNLQADRGQEKTNQALAQAAYAGGSLNTGGYQQAQQQALEQEAADKANFSGNLINQAEQSRQQQLNQLLGLGSSQGLQEQLSGGQLGLGYSQLQEAMNRDAMLAALGAYGG